MFRLHQLSWSVLVAAAFISGTVWHFATAQEARPKQQWEYHYGNGFTKENMKQMGEDGWELVAAVPHLPGIADSNILYFKRLK